MKIVVIIIGIIFLKSCASSNNKLAEINLSNKTNIPSTRVYIEIPEGFQLSERLIGIEKNDYVAISVMDLIGGNFYKNAAEVNVESFEKMGLIVKSFKGFEIQG